MLFSEGQHPLNAIECFLASWFSNKNFAALVFEAMQNIRQAVHRHPGAVGTALAGGAITRRGRLD